MNERTANHHLAARAEDSREVTRILGCSSDACCQGRRACPTPSACLLPESRYDSDGIGLLRWLGSALILAFGALTAAHFIARVTA